tara:strand:+ start:183 stop:509 length:327 start_codon:yes stop_codon:yes gene_type:complete
MQNFKVYLLIVCLIFLTKCTSYETATVIDNEACKISKVNKKTFLICDEHNNLKVYIKKELWSPHGRKTQVVKELKDCKNVSVALEKKNSYKKYNSIMCKTDDGYEIVR